MLYGTYTDCYPTPGVTVRMVHDSKAWGHAAEVFVGGWRVGKYKSALGIQNAVLRYKKVGAECAARYAAGAGR